MLGHATAPQYPKYHSSCCCVRYLVHLSVPSLTKIDLIDSTRPDAVPTDQPSTNRVRGTVAARCTLQLVEIQKATESGHVTWPILSLELPLRLPIQGHRPPLRRNFPETGWHVLCIDNMNSVFGSLISGRLFVLRVE